MTARGDRLLGLGLLVLAVAYGWAAQQWPEPFGGSEAVGPETFPTILAWVMGISSLYLIVRPDPDDQWPLGRTGLEMVIAVLVLVAYAWLMEPIGFIPATTFTVGVLSWRMGAPPLRAAVTGLISSVTVFVLFNTLLDLSLPAGILEFN